MHVSVTVHMAAPPERIWPLVSDVTKVGEFSPETFEAEWLDGATGPAVGARFRGHVRRNGWRWAVYWTTCKVVACEPNREFAFQVITLGKPSSTWRYVLRPDADGTDVTESFQLEDTAPLRLYWWMLGWSRGRTNNEGMRRTLEGVRAVAESTTAPGAAKGDAVGEVDEAGRSGSEPSG